MTLIPTGEDKEGNTQWKTTREVLLEKHPQQRMPSTEILLHDIDSNQSQHDPVMFDRITGDLIKEAATKIQGSAGPSGVDAHQWRRFCLSYKSASVDLCNALGAVARRLCTTPVNPEGLSAFVACRLVPLDKNPGVRPIGIGEVPRRIIAKTVLTVVRDDVQEAAGPLQTCAGHQAGCEAAVHAVNQIMKSEDTEAALLVDATNAFNTLNRQAALHNIQVTCPAISTILKNTYQAPVRMFVAGGEEIASMEGTTQGDPLAMAMYALAIAPLINHLKEKTPNAKQVWFADDSNAMGRLKALNDWWLHLTNLGPKFGYFPNASKTTLVVKEEFIDEATTLFGDTGINITVEGHRMLGAACGKRSFVDGYVASKIKEWESEIEILSEVAEMYPHAVYTVFTRAFVLKWQYLMRTIGDIADLFQSLENKISTKLIPALTGRAPCSIAERRLLSLPTRFGGLNLVNPVEATNILYDSSLKITEPLKKLIIDQSTKYVKFNLHEIKSDLRKQKSQHYQSVANEVRESLCPIKQRNMDLLQLKGSSSWLSALPLKDQGFSLNKGEFRDALCLRYGWQMKNLPQYCICGNGFSIDHAMICPHGGMTIRRHNEIRDLTADWINEVCRETEIEPTLQPLDGEVILPRSSNKQDDARVDIKTIGFWGRQQSAFFDVRIFHPNAPSSRNTSINAQFRKHELAKKREYGDRVREVENGSFTPLVFSTTGSASRETTVVYKRLADLLANKRNSPYSITLAWMRCQISFALTKSAISCMRGSRVRRRHTDMGIATDMAESNFYIN